MCYPLGTLWHPNWKAHGKKPLIFLQYMPLSDLASVFLHSALRGLPPVVAAENTRDDVRCLHWLSSFPENHQGTPKRRGLKAAYYTILPTQIMHSIFWINHFKSPWTIPVLLFHPSITWTP